MKKFKKKSPRLLINNELSDSIDKIKDNIEIIIETGTFDGLGSTTMLAEIFKNSETLQKFYTIEVDNRIFLRARRNLKKYPFIECFNGLSINYKECVEFMENDNFIKNYNDINFLYGDDVIGGDAINTYKLELQGSIFIGPSPFQLKDFDEDILIKLLNENIEKRILILLDSSGGIGYLEFQKITEMLKNKSYYLLLDDINHLKHYRSYLYIKDNPEYEILYLNYEDGILLCQKK